MGREMATMTAARTVSSGRSVGSSLGRTAPFRASGDMEKSGGISRSVNPFGRDMAVIARPSLPERKAPRIMERRYPGRLIKPREIPRFKTRQNPLEMPVYKPNREAFSFDRIVPKNEPITAMRTLAKGRVENPAAKVSDSQKLARIRSEIQKYIKPVKISVAPDNKPTVAIAIKSVAKIERPDVKNLSSQIALQVPKLNQAMLRETPKNTGFLNQFLDRQAVKITGTKKQEVMSRQRVPNVNKLPEKTVQPAINQLLERLKKTPKSPIHTIISPQESAAVTQTAAQIKKAAVHTETAPVMAPMLHDLTEYVRLLEELEKKKGTKFAQEKAQALPLAAFVETAKKILNAPAPKEKVKTVLENQAQKSRIVTQKETIQRRVVRFASSKNQPEKPFLLEEDPVADKARIGFAVKAAKDLFKVKDPNRPREITGRAIAWLMPDIPQPTEVKSSLLMRLRQYRMHRDGSYDEVLKQLGKSGVLNSVEDTKLRMHELVTLFPAVRVGGERVTTRAVSEEDVVRVFGGKLETSGDDEVNERDITN